MGGVAKEPIFRVELVAGDLLHPRAVGSDSDTSDVNGAGAQLDHEEDHVPNGAEDAEAFDGEELSQARGTFTPRRSQNRK